MRAERAFYIRVPRWRADTQHLTCAQHGAYMLLLMFAHNKGAIPDDPKVQARIVAARSASAWSAISRGVLEFFVPNPNGAGLVPCANYAGDRIAEGRQMDVPMSVWRVLRREVLARDDFTCRYCGSQEQPLDCDHVEPLARGGVSHPDNLVAACQACNRSKGAKTLYQWGGRA